jgi:hypothetical protein
MEITLKKKEFIWKSYLKKKKDFLYTSPRKDYSSKNSFIFLQQTCYHGFGNLNN